MIELTVALHYVFTAPQDRILWDVGHQVTQTVSSEHGLLKLYPVHVKLYLPGVLLRFLCF